MTLSISDQKRVDKTYTTLFYNGGNYGVLVDAGILITNVDNGQQSIISDHDDVSMLYVARKARGLIENKQYNDLLAILESPTFSGFSDSNKALLLNTVIIEKILMDEMDEAEDMKYD